MTTVSFLWRLLFFYQPPLRKLYKNVVWKATMYLYAIKQIYCRHSMASGIFLPISLIQRKRPFPVQMYRKRPEIKGFHGSIGSSGRAVKAFFLYTVVIVETACKVTPPADLPKEKLNAPSSIIYLSSGKMILLTKKKITIDTPPFRTVVPML